jgi:IS30 family transposase
MSQKELLVNELHKQVRKNFPRLHVKLKGINDLWQADFVEMTQFSKENKGFKYLMTVIDCFTKYAWAVPLKNKSSTVVSSALEKIIREKKEAPVHLQTDNGTEFYNSTFKKLMEKYKIKHYSSYSHLKASIVERFNRTLKNMMWKQFSLQGSYKWLPILQSTLQKYNNNFHRTIQTAPLKNQ